MMRYSFICLHIRGTMQQHSLRQEMALLVPLPYLPFSKYFAPNQMFLSDKWLGSRLTNLYLTILRKVNREKKIEKKGASLFSRLLKGASKLNVL